MQKSNEHLNRLALTLFEVSPTKSQRAQVQIVEKAIELFADVGFHETSYADIAKKAKVSRALVQHYFPAREDLFHFAVQFIRANMQSIAVKQMASSANAEDYLSAYVNSTFFWIKEYNSHARLWLMFYFYSAIDMQSRKLNTELVQVGEKRIQSIIQLGVTQGLWACAEVIATAKSVQNLITGCLLQSLTEEYAPQTFQDLERQAVVGCMVLLQHRK